jgi:hypothetical protein
LYNRYIMADLTRVKMTDLPKCSFCLVEALYDFRTLDGSWAYGCAKHWELYRMYPDLGMGKGQSLVRSTDH